MAMMTAFQLGSLVLREVERARAFGLAGDLVTPRTPGRAGAPKVIAPALERCLVERIEAAKRDRLALEGGRPYGERCTWANAIRFVMRNLHRERLIADGQAPAQADRLVAEYAATPEFEQHVVSHKVALSRYRRLHKGR